MTQTVWCFTKGDKKIFTKSTELVDQAMKEGLGVEIISKKPTKFMR